MAAAADPDDLRLEAMMSQDGYRTTGSRRRLRLIVAAVIAFLTTAWIVATPATAAATTHRPSVVCVPFTATGLGQDLGGGQTQGTISVGRLVVGSTVASFTISGVTGTLASFSGPLVFTPRLVPATVTAQLVGTLDVSSGAFAATSTSVSGTGVLRSVTGDLAVRGNENLLDGTFTETLTGRLCVPVGQREALARATTGQ